MSDSPIVAEAFLHFEVFLPTKRANVAVDHALEVLEVEVHFLVCVRAKRAQTREPRGESRGRRGLSWRGSGYGLGLNVHMIKFLSPFESFRKSWIVCPTVLSLSVVM